MSLACAVFCREAPGDKNTRGEHNLRLHRLPARLLCLAAVCLLLQVGGAKASEHALHQEISSDTLTLEDLSIGYNGLVTYTKAMPLTVTLSNTGADISGILAVNLYANQRQYDRYELPLTLAGGTRRQVTLTPRLSSRQDTFTVEFIKEGQTVCSKNLSPLRVINPETLLVGILSPDPAALSYLNIDKDNDELRRDEKWQTVALTKESFPESETLLHSFGLLVIDGFDASSLSAKQLSALDGWLREGGVLVLGGGAQAATVYPAFSAYTGLTPGQVAQAPDITGTLADFLGVTEEPLGKETLLNALPAADALVSSGENGLLHRSQVGNGMIYIAAFEWGAKPLSSWPLMHTLLQRLLLKDCPEAYQSLLNLDRYAQNDTDWSMNEAARSIRVKNTASAVPMLVLAVVYLLVGGVGGYLLLKKLDKREWLWGLFPALTVACVVGIALLGRTGGFSQPIAVTFAHYNLDAGEGVKTYAALSTSDGAEHRISSPDGDVLPSNTDYFGYYSYYDDDDSANQKRIPTELRYRFLLGENQAVSLPFGAPWTVKSIIIKGRQPKLPDIQATLWPEADGLHGRIENRSDFPLREGVVLTSMGFCSIPDLQPGEKTEFALIEPPREKQTSFTDGALLPQLMDNSYYSMVYAYLYPESGARSQQKLSPPEEAERETKRSLLISAFSGDSIYADGNSFFRFVAFQDELKPAALYLDGQEITRSASRSMVSMAVPYTPVGPDGWAYYTPGLLTPTVAEPGPVPKDTAVAIPGGYKTYRLEEKPTFCFTLPQGADLAVSSLRFLSQYYGAYVDIGLYNWERGMWDTIEDGAEMTGAQATPYFRDGQLFVQYRAPAGSGEGYSEVLAPSLEIRGRLK